MCYISVIRVMPEKVVSATRDFSSCGFLEYNLRFLTVGACKILTNILNGMVPLNLNAKFGDLEFFILNGPDIYQSRVCVNLTRIYIFFIRTYQQFCLG